MKKKEQSLPLKKLKELLSYNKETGVFHWKERPDMESFNSRLAGKIAGDVCKPKSKTVYCHITILGKTYLAHRLAWFYINEEWPTMLDHIDGNPLNNSIYNLKITTHLENSKNVKQHKTGLKGAISGVNYMTEPKYHKNPWRAKGGYTRLSDKKYITIYLGFYKTKEEAIAARLAWQQANGYSERHGKPAPETPEDRFIKALQERGSDTRARPTVEQAIQMLKEQPKPSDEYRVLYDKWIETGIIPEECKELFVI